MQVLTDAQWAKFEATIAAVKLRGRGLARRTGSIEAIIRRLDITAEVAGIVPLSALVTASAGADFLSDH